MFGSARGCLQCKADEIQQGNSKQHRVRETLLAERSIWSIFFRKRSSEGVSRVVKAETPSRLRGDEIPMQQLLVVIGYVVMPEHVHLLIRKPSGASRHLGRNTRAPVYDEGIADDPCSGVRTEELRCSSNLFGGH